ncbi:hypothetical protein WUBG_16729 [Wuchereria bancrofti]|uniref:Uncharacterized protein n=1 Tax=Wuchereria bancrofti TaxID=6293 RepID=J9AEB0_WUCBA|nr:hypothetical protein WUBG_16729 [Wuchereria bancrofti]
MLNTVQHRHVAIARLSHPTNLGRTMQDLRFIIIVIAPSRAVLQQNQTGRAIYCLLKTICDIRINQFHITDEKYSDIRQSCNNSGKIGIFPSMHTYPYCYSHTL